MSRAYDCFVSTTADNIRGTVMLATLLTMASGCAQTVGSGRRLYEGPPLPPEAVITLFVEPRAAVLSVDGTELRAEPSVAVGDKEVYDVGQQGRFDLLPGKHVLKAQYCHIDVRHPWSGYVEHVLVVSKEAVFELDAGAGAQYRLTAVPRLDVPFGGFFVDIRLEDRITRKVVASKEVVTAVCVWPGLPLPHRVY